MERTINEMTYAYDVTGEGEPLLLFHGFTGSQKTWDSFIPVWSKYFQVITVDLPGHGKTDSPRDIYRYSTESTVQDLVQLLDHLQINQVHLLGYSMGGRLALSFAFTHPERVKTLILESASPGLQTQSERRSRIEQDEQLAKMIEEQGIFIFVQYWENITLFSSQKRLPKLVQEKVRQERLQQNPLGLANSLRGLGTGKQPSWWEDLSNLQVPTYIIVGGLDEKFKQIGKSMVEMLPQARLVTVPDAGHAIHVEKQGKFGTMIVDILLQKREEQ